MGGAGMATTMSLEADRAAQPATERGPSWQQHLGSLVFAVRERGCGCGRRIAAPIGSGLGLPRLRHATRGRRGEPRGADDGPPLRSRIAYLYFYLRSTLDNDETRHSPSTAST